MISVSAAQNNGAVGGQGGWGVGKGGGHLGKGVPAYFTRTIIVLVIISIVLI